MTTAWIIWADHNYSKLWKVKDVNLSSNKNKFIHGFAVKVCFNFIIFDLIWLLIKKKTLTWLLPFLNEFDCNLGEWNVKYEDCYSQCGLKGGTCSYCNNGYLEGYCCRKDAYGGNGDCPQSAIQSIPNDKKYHLCVSRHKSRHFNKSIRIKKKFSH